MMNAISDYILMTFWPWPLSYFSIFDTCVPAPESTRRVYISQTGSVEYIVDACSECLENWNYCKKLSSLQCLL